MGRPVKTVTAHGFYNSGGKHKTRVDGKKTKACQLWENIRLRLQALPEMNESKFGKYLTVTIDESWKDFQSFAEWVNCKTIPEGWVLDKDLLGCNRYGPESCVFLPDEVNKALSTKVRVRGEFPLGVSLNKNTGKFDIQYDCKNPEFHFRAYAETVMPAWLGYKKSREGYIRHLAVKYKTDLDPVAYQALLGYVITLED